MQAERTKILVIDDEEVIRQLIRDALDPVVYDVVLAGSGEEGFQEAMKTDFNLMIVDINLPGDNGLKIIEHIKKNDPDVIMIVMTGCDSPDYMRMALRLGVFDYVAKPFDLEQMSFVIKRAADASGLIRTNKQLMRDLSEQNRMLESKIEERTKHLAMTYQHMQQMYLKMIMTLVTVLEAKDPYTRYHSENVAKYSVIIAQAMELPVAQIELIEKAAKLHDIGKISILDAILNKPDKLTKEEFEQIKMHPTKAEEILRPLDFLSVATELIKQHHERYDGTGYPAGLKGEEIKLGARIMAIADSYDAMISDRAYRKTKFTKETAIAEIERNAGTQFDPKVIEAFKKAVDKF